MISLKINQLLKLQKWNTTWPHSFMDNKEHYKLMNKKIDTETVKQQTDCQITAGRIGRYGGDKRSSEGLVCMHISKTNGRKTLGRECISGSGGGNGKICTHIIPY